MNMKRNKFKGEIREEVALLIHKWYSGYDMATCPNGPECGLMKSCRFLSDKILKTTGTL